MPLNVTFECNSQHGNDNNVSLNNRSLVSNGLLISTHKQANNVFGDEFDSKCQVKLTSFTQHNRRKVSTIMSTTRDCRAVEVRRLKYLVGRGKRAKTILSGINMTVPEGAIYGLLGPSGSGKTTLLKSVVGQITPSEGYVKVFGFQPNQPGSQIPGPAVGYMPQELALYEDFSIKETLWYFGRLYKVAPELLKERISFLLSFLDLPSHKRLVINLSGGQKRRVSLASALVHSPPLLILDEPTVGVDPLLRQSIWQHLVTLTQTEKITVIVTTHYIEEASRANIVGLMRRGRLLAENKPTDLLAKHNSASLEDVFLKLCVTDTMRRSQAMSTMTMTSSVKLSNEPSSVRISGSSASSAGKLGSLSPAPIAMASIGNESTISGGSNNSESATIEPSSSVEDIVTGGDGSVTDGLVVSSSAANCKQRSTSSSSGKLIDSSLPLSSKLHKRIKSILKLSAVVDNNNELTGTTMSRDDELKMIKQQTGNEPRRESGSHFIEQLMSELRKDNKQIQQNNQVNVGTTTTTTTAAVSKLTIQKTNKQTNNNKDQNSVGGYSNPSYETSETNHNDTSANNDNRQQQQHESFVTELSLIQQTRDQKILNSLVPDNTTTTTTDSQRTSSASSLSSSSSNEVAPTTQTTTTMIQQQQQQQQTNNKPTTGNINILLSPTTNKSFDDDTMMLETADLFLDTDQLSTMSPGIKFDYRKQSVADYCDSIQTITWKNYTRLKRNVPLLLFQFLLPAIQVVLFCICVGNDPFDIPVAVVNEESSADSFAALSTKFLTSINPKLVRLVNYTDLQLAIKSVQDGKNWGVIHIPENFTLSIHRRFSSGLDDSSASLDDITIENSTIKVYPDMTSQPIGHAMEVAFRQAYTSLSRATFDFVGLNPAMTEPPIRMEAAIYGQLHMQNYLQYMSPGVLISISYIMATGLTSLAFIIERRDGSYDRTLAAGVDHIQMLLSHAIVQIVVMVVQISLVVFFTFVIYKVPTNGPFGWVFLLLLLQGLAGMCFGLMVSSICSEENTAIMMILGTFYPNLLLAGVIWPIEAIPYWLRWFSYLQPQTLPTQSLRDLIVRGWSIDKRGVWSGFAVTSVWLLVFLTISSIAFKLKK